MPFIRSELGQSVGAITLDNPAGFELEKARAVVLRAAPGVTVWSSGHDVDELPRAVAIPWVGTTRCATSCGASRPFRPR